MPRVLHRAGLDKRRLVRTQSSKACCYAPVFKAQESFDPLLSHYEMALAKHSVLALINTKHDPCESIFWLTFVPIISSIRTAFRIFSASTFCEKQGWNKGDSDEVVKIGLRVNKNRLGRVFGYPRCPLYLL